MSSGSAEVAAALLLAVAAGTVDAVSYVALHHVFTANMTGNTTELGIAVSHNDVFSLVPLAIAIVLFVGAIALGTAGIELATRRGVRSSAAPVFLLEVALLAVFMVDGRRILRGGVAPDHAAGGYYLLLTVAVVAMGMQTAGLTRALGAVLHTTYVSGLITTFTQELVNLAARHDRDRPSYLRDELRLGSRGRSARRVTLHLAVWVAFICGGMWGAYAEGRWTTWALAVPLAALLAAAAIDLRRPLHSRARAGR